MPRGPRHVNLGPVGQSLEGRPPEDGNRWLVAVGLRSRGTGLGVEPRVLSLRGLPPRGVGSVRSGTLGVGWEGATLLWGGSREEGRHGARSSVVATTWVGGGGWETLDGRTAGLDDSLPSTFDGSRLAGVWDKSRRN